MENINDYSDKFFLLKIYFDGLDPDICEKYISDITNQQRLVEKYINRYFINNSKVNHSCNLDYSIDEQHIYIDSGFDLYTPSLYNVAPNSLVKVKSCIKTAMYYDSIPCGFYLYSRSSTGTKTPLRLANNVGVIDSGYRGNCLAVFDNNSDQSYCINKGDRLVQICAGNLLYPIYPVIVNTVDELGTTERGSDGFGSTGR